MDIANDLEGASRITAFRQKIQQLGWAEGHNVQIDVCWTNGERDGVRACAAQLVRSAPDVILVSGPFALNELRQATQAIPIVFVQIGEPIESGVAPSLRNPGGNITGSAAFPYSIAAKWAELLKQIAPRVGRVAVLQSSSMFTHAGYLRAIEAAAPALGMKVTASDSDLANDAEIESVITAITRESNGLIVLASPAAAVHRTLIASLAARNRLPSIYPYRHYVTSGGLMSYGNDVTTAFHRAASLVDRILQGTRPSDLPIQFPATFELAINLRTAEAIGLTVPPLLLARADKVIE